MDAGSPHHVHYDCHPGQECRSPRRVAGRPISSRYTDSRLVCGSPGRARICAVPDAPPAWTGGEDGRQGLALPVEPRLHWVRPRRMNRRGRSAGDSRTPRTPASAGRDALAEAWRQGGRAVRMHYAPPAGLRLRSPRRPDGGCDFPPGRRVAQGRPSGVLAPPRAPRGVPGVWVVRRRDLIPRSKNASNLLRT